MNRKQARERWNLVAFQEQVDSHVRRIVQGECVLQDADLSGISIGVEGPIASLWGANLYKARLTDVDMCFAELACSLDESVLTGVRFVESRFDRCLIRDAEVTGCDFIGAKLVVTLNDSAFNQCDFTKAIFSGGRMGHEYGGGVRSL